MPDGGIKIGIAGRIAATSGIGLADAACPMNKHFIEPALSGLIRVFVGQMPFAKDARRIAC